MKINDASPQVEASTQLEEQFFSIQDQGMIFDILRNKMYSNPILAICREISCNARDAHREVKKELEPIHIYIPTSGEPFFKVKDFGPGISPDRMSNIFIKYTASTKRNDNIQTGGFGLGAKTPFSYSDTFTIVTNYNGVRYNYACFIDETKIGKLSLLAETPTKEGNGTEIIVPVKEKDFHLFEEYTEFCTRHWDIKPIIKGTNISWRSPSSIMSGNGWCISSSDHWNRGVKLIVDGVEYPLDLNTLRSYGDLRIIDSAKGNLLLYFGVGELSLSASREQIYLDPATKLAISNRLNDIYNEIRSTTQNIINECANLWEANIYYRNSLQQAFHNLGFLGKLSWHGTDLLAGHPDLGCNVINFVKGKYHRRFGTDPNKISKATNRSLSFSKDSLLFLNDLGIKELTTKHVKKAFENYPSISSVQVICPNDKISVESLNAQWHLDLMSPHLLSSVAKVSKRTNKNNSSRLIVFKFDDAVCNFKQSSYSALESDNKFKVLCFLSKDSGQYNSSRQINVKGNIIPHSVFYELSRQFHQYSFYGVDSNIPSERLEEDFSDLQDLEEFIEEKVINKSHDEYVAIKYSNTMKSSIAHTVHSYKELFRNKIANNNSLFLKRLELFDLLSNMPTSDLKSLSVYEFVNGHISKEELDVFGNNHPELNLTKLDEECDARYPLLNLISGYEYKDNINHIVDYVDMIDSYR